jgi:hypothetical protein
MKSKHSETTLLTLANGAELVAIVVQELAGNEVASQINGSPLTRSVIHDMAVTSFQDSMSRKLGGR